jgi:hypothetical protein
LLTHPAAAVALNVGEADATASVVAAGDSVTVEPRVIAIGLTDIVGTLGWVMRLVVGDRRNRRPRRVGSWHRQTS